VWWEGAVSSVGCGLWGIFSGLCEACVVVAVPGVGGFRWGGYVLWALAVNGPLAANGSASWRCPGVCSALLASLSLSGVG